MKARGKRERLGPDTAPAGRSKISITSVVAQGDGQLRIGLEDDFPTRPDLVRALVRRFSAAYEVEGKKPDIDVRITSSQFEIFITPHDKTRETTKLFINRDPDATISKQTLEELRDSGARLLPDIFRANPELFGALKNKSDYTDKTMGDAAHDLNALAANLGLTFEEAAAKLTAGKKTARRTVAPRADNAAVVRALAGLEHLQRQFDEAARLPEAERARIGRQFVAAFERAQRRGIAIDVEMVREARRFLTGYNRRQRAAKLAVSPAA